MRPQVVSITGAGSSDPIMVDRLQTPTNIGLGVIVSGTVNYTVQHTFDNVNDPDVTPTWLAHSDLAALTASADGNYAFPPRFVRITNNSGTGTSTLTLIQAGY